MRSAGAVTSDPGARRHTRFRVVAHRAGNELHTSQEAAAAGYVIEADVHVFRGRVEVRHEKALRPTSRLWERWYLLPGDTRRVELVEILDAAEPDVEFLLDLKCFTRRAARRIRSEVPAWARVTVSARSWWTLSVFADRADAVALLSCGNRAQLWLAGRLPGLGTALGITAHERLLSPEIIARIRHRTPHVYAWALTTRDRCLLLADAGLTGLVLDDPTVAPTHPPPN